MSAPVLSLLHGVTVALVVHMSSLVWIDCGKACGAAPFQHKLIKFERPRSAR